MDKKKLFLTALAHYTRGGVMALHEYLTTLTPEESSWILAEFERTDKNSELAGEYILAFLSEVAGFQINNPESAMGVIDDILERIEKGQGFPHAAVIGEAIFMKPPPKAQTTIVLPHGVWFTNSTVRVFRAKTPRRPEDMFEIVTYN